MSDKPKSIGAGWKKTLSSGTEIISITIGEGPEAKRYTLWPNSYKTEDKHPDFKIQEDNYKPQSNG